MEARSRTLKLNVQIRIKAQEERLRKIEIEETKQREVFTSLFCVELLSEFENHFIRARDIETELRKKKTSRAGSYEKPHRK